jgi:hypothetical protein
VHQFFCQLSGLHVEREKVPRRFPRHLRLPTQASQQNPEIPDATTNYKVKLWVKEVKTHLIVKYKSYALYLSENSVMYY